MQELIQKFEPDQIFIEYNGMWEVGPLLENGFLDECELYQSLACVDTTFNQYLKNMRPLIMEQLFAADVIIFNRCTTETPKTKYRTAIKGQNKKGAQLVYERMIDN